MLCLIPGDSSFPHSGKSKVKMTKFSPFQVNSIPRSLFLRILHLSSAVLYFWGFHHPLFLGIPTFLIPEDPNSFVFLRIPTFLISEDSSFLFLRIPPLLNPEDLFPQIPDTPLFIILRILPFLNPEDFSSSIHHLSCELPNSLYLRFCCSWILKPCPHE